MQISSSLAAALAVGHGRAARYAGSFRSTRLEVRPGKIVLPATIQRFGSTTNLRNSDRLTISRLIWRQVGAVRPESWPLIPAVGVELQQEGVEAEQRRHQQHATIAVLDVGGVDDGLHQQALGVDENMALLALDLLSRVVTRRIDRRPPFSALFTLSLSMTAAVGLASRPSASRHFT